MSGVRMLRTDAEDIEDDEVFIAHVQKMEARRLSPRCRCGNGATGFLHFTFLFLFLILHAVFAPCNSLCLVHTALPFKSSGASCAIFTLRPRGRPRNQSQSSLQPHLRRRSTHPRWPAHLRPRDHSAAYYP